MKPSNAEQVVLMFWDLLLAGTIACPWVQPVSLPLPSDTCACRRDWPDALGTVDRDDQEDLPWLSQKKAPG